MPPLKVIAVDKSFSKKQILSDISFETGNGELIVILGPSGCGKSTLLRLIAGLEEQDKGEIFIGTGRVDMLPPRKRNVALVFQNYALYPHMTVEKNLSFPLKVARLPKAEIKRRVRETAELIGLSDRLDAHPAELSGGQRQRVALGRAIIRQPDLFLLDEPLSNLDADLRTRMRREIVDLQKKLGVTTVYVTHDQVEALTMADRMVVLESGKIRQIGTVDEIYNHPADLFVASFIGTPKINLLTAKVENNIIKPFNLPSMLIPEQYSNREITLGLRPEDIILNPDGEFSAVVKEAEYLGDKCIVHSEFTGQSLTVVSEPGQYDAGDHLRFNIKTDKIHIFDTDSGVSCRS